MKIIYLIGQPGVGKSTLLHEAIGDRIRQGQYFQKPFAHVLFKMQHKSRLSCYLGDPSGAFPGTDRLSMSVQPKVLQWMNGDPVPLVIGEGDRLGCRSFFEKAIEYHKLKVIYIDGYDYHINLRRASRAQETGQKQNPTWLAGRITKIQNTLEYCKTAGIEVVTILNDNLKKATRELKKQLS